MNRFLASLALASATVPAVASGAVTMRFECDHAAAEGSEPSKLAGLWDTVMDVAGIPSFGLLSIGLSENGLAGSLSLNAGVVVVRSLASDGRTVTMIVASAEGDVRFDGALAADGKRMCGVVNYHGGRKFEMVAQKRPQGATIGAAASAP